MKLYYSGFLLFFFFNLSSQTPRLSLFEEFTGETCPPCAATNPGLNAILASPTNTPKVVAIKWQVPIPSAPSKTWSLYQTNKNEIDWRYQSVAAGGYGYMSQWTQATTPSGGINAAPTGFIDGQHQWVFGAASDHPMNINNTVIASAQSYTSAFSVTMQRAWDANFSSINLTVNIVATANFSAVPASSANASGTLVFRTVMVERNIHFNTQPGTNGEKDFEDVAIASFPNLQTGVAMAPTWTVGQTQSFTLNCVIPAYVRDIAELAFVGFIQDEVSREVAQAVRADKAPMDNDAKAITVTIPEISCGSSFTPGLQILNNGTLSITALTITPYFDGIATTPISWMGNLPGLTSTIIPAGSFSTQLAGTHSFSFLINTVSGGDGNTSNNAAANSFYVVNAYQKFPILEDFAGAVFPPATWGVVNTNGGVTWMLNTNVNGVSMLSGIGGAEVEFYTNSELGDKDEFILPPINLSGSTTPTLTFDVAYAQYTNEEDSLELYISVDCGKTWNAIYANGGSSLSTVAPQTIAFIPTQSTQWRAETLPLFGYNVNEVLLKFVSTSDYGNNLYIDNINLAQTNPVGIKTNKELNEQLKLYPNPSKGMVTLKLPNALKGNIELLVSNVLGQNLIHTNTTVQAGNATLSLDLSELPVGIYNVQVHSEMGYSVTTLSILR